MTIIQCPRCGKQVSVMPHSGDFVHNCNDMNSCGSASRMEDIPVQEVSATDFDGTFTRGPNEVMLAGMNGEYTPLGNNSQTHRTRSHYEHIELNPDGTVKDEMECDYDD